MPRWTGTLVPMSTRTAYHHGDLRSALLRASLALIDEAGIGALSLREVARKAGVSHNAPYHHFKDRGSLLAALVEDGFAALDTLMTAIVEAQAGGLAPAGDPKPLVLTCWAAVHGLASLWLDGPLARAQRMFATSPDKLTALVPATLTALLTGAAHRPPDKRRK